MEQASKEETEKVKPRSLLSLFWPFDELRKLSESDNRNLLVITTIGVVPMVILTLFSMLIQSQIAYLLTGLYFSVLWSILFYNLFPAPAIRVSTSLFCFVGTALVSVSILSLFFKLPFVNLPLDFIQSPSHLERFMGFWLWVALPEELVKVFMLYVLSRRHNIKFPSTFAYYGMICGLGFGIYEGMDYQMTVNFDLADGMEEYLFLNLLRLTTLPVLHAVWTGTAGFFLGFVFLHGQKKYYFVLVGLGIPSVLHALFNTFNHSVASLGLAIMSVLVFSLYFAKHDSLNFYFRQQSNRHKE
ncbi:PrsW family intramembrane metalloprotease [Verrucomicrobia bacterium]|nr:PrsW family intramembrane metalloprotease [Verrucomicrobiota bacterium]